MCSRPAAPERKRALVTGGTGFVGANLVRRLLLDGHELGLLVGPSHDPWRLAEVSGQVRWLDANLESGASLSAMLADFRPHWIFHLAAHGAYSWQRDQAAILSTNVLGTANLLEACLGVGFEVFVNTGSSSEYGSKDHAAHEDEPLEPDSPYAVGKAAATMYCWQSARATGAPIVTLRLYSVYGPYEEPRRFIPQLVARGLEGRLPPLANPATARDFVYVDDVCDAYLRVAASRIVSGAIYNVGTGVQTTLSQAVELARRVLQIEVEPSWRSMPDRSWDTSTWLADTSRLRTHVGWSPPTALESGLARTADWMRGRPDLNERYRAASS
jgi:nucleoside-diphosphate-sugar epimerase